MVAREKKDKYNLFTVLTIIISLILAGRFAQLILFPDSRTDSPAVYAEPDVSDRVERGTIYDRNGIPLAMEVPYYSCAVMLQSVESREKVAEELSPILFMTQSDILETMEGKTVYALIKHRLSPEESELIRKNRTSGRLKGVVLEKRYGRSYPQTYHAAQVIGFSGIDSHGLEGLELYYDDILSPLPGTGETLTSGNDIYLTLDNRIQFFTDTHIQDIADIHNPDSAMAIVMDAHTGNILAWSSYPWYDLNNYRESTAGERLNRPAVSMYEPGSVFKVYSLASIMDIGEIETRDPFICDGSYSFTMPNGNEAVINCVSPHGSVGPREILKYSCNGAIAHFALQTDPDRFYESLLDFGFSSASGIELPGEISGLLNPPETWSGRSMPTIAFGQEIGVTALQMTYAATALSNAGLLLKPSIVSHIVAPDGTNLFQATPNVLRRVLSEETAANILEMMISATEPGGTAIHAQAPNIETAAKTGTAQILDPETRSYSPDHVLASCLALFPAADPEYIIYVAVDNPKSGQFYGSAVAAPAIGYITTDLVSTGLVKSDKSVVLLIHESNEQVVIDNAEVGDNSEEGTGTPE